jgi:hypothetical protein
MNEQNRREMTTDTPGTLPYIVKKWSPLTEGMDKHPHEICSWAMEQEAKYLRTVVDDNGSQLGSALKFIFPVIRSAVFTLTADQTVLTANVSRHVIHEVVAESLGYVAEKAAGPCEEPEFSGNLLDNELVIALTDRLCGYIESFPG